MSPAPSDTHNAARRMSAERDGANLVERRGRTLKPYSEYLKEKLFSDVESGFEPGLINKKLFPFQREVVKWALRRGRAAIFEDTGLGKTFQQLEWAKHVYEKTKKNVLILAPLCVSIQTKKEAEKIDIDVNICRKQEDMKSGLNITNYEMMEHFEFNDLAGIVLDESSILKGQDSKTKTRLIEICQRIPYRLSCTATPSPNDYMELGNQAEFLGIMTAIEMLSMFFTHDGGETSKWRLKGHGRVKFWEWLSTWAVCIKKPSDIGFDNAGYDLNPLHFHEHKIKTEKKIEGELFTLEAQTLSERIKARAETVDDRARRVFEIVDGKEQWLVWCNLNSESDKLAKLISDAEDIKGADSIQEKERKTMDFMSGKLRVLISKPSISGFGMNFQFCQNMAFVGLSDSYEQIYQAIRRCYRFGQKKTVNVHFVSADIEGAVLKNIQRKEKQAQEMSIQMVKHMADFTKKRLGGTVKETMNYETDVFKDDEFEIHLGDCVEMAKKIKNESVDLSVFSPPFASLYTYTNSERDMGNCKKDEDFYEHFKYLVKELFRITVPGRHVAFHCMNLPSSKQRDGVIGIKDFRGELIRIFESEGFVYHSEVTIWKDPVTAMQRTKALGLLHKTIRKDSSMARCGIPDYVVTMRKPGVNPKPISHTHEQFPVSLWQKIASPVWDDIDPSNTLNRQGARETDDERHICPLQLDVIKRILLLWSQKGDLVFSPFMGIGSEGFMSIKYGRKFLGVELKKSYYNLAKSNLLEAKKHTEDLFSGVN